MRSLHFVLLSLPFAALEARASFQPYVVEPKVDKVYVPLGFDDNDNIEMTIRGNFPSTCYKTGPSKVDVDQAKKLITIEPKAYLYGGFCSQVVIPYTQTLKLGVIPGGSYKIVVKGSPAAMSTPLVVKRATTESADDFLYAPVQSGTLTERGDAVRLEGEWPLTLTGCMVMSDIRVQLTGGHVVLVQPIAKLTDGPECDEQKASHRFSVEAPLPATVQKGEYLLHVRALNGNAVNNLVNFAN